MNLLKTIQSWFSKTPDIQPESDVIFPALVSQRQFQAFAQKNRMQAVMLTGDSGDLKHYTFMKWCVMNDPDIHVRLSALKRITNFNVQPDLNEFLLQLSKRSDRKILEPYLSFALNRMGLISDDELQARLNND